VEESKIAKLVRMANQIDDFFRPYPDEAAVAGVQEHLRNFWTPRMRSELSAHAKAGGKGLHPHVAEALRRWAEAESPVERVTEGPKELGQLASDAG
jgi:formate dehydrogenase subunit delta